jgi:hypothetical protein
MGANEEIIDDSGTDFTVFAKGGNYVAWVTDDLDQGFKMLGTGSGNHNFDLGVINFPKARYVRIEYLSGDNVLLDAIVARNFNKIEKDTRKPQITGPDDFWVWDNQTTITFTWSASDRTPWNYTILIDGELADSGSWNGNNITFTLPTPDSSEVILTIVLYDVFGNQVEDDVTIEIRTRNKNVNTVGNKNINTVSNQFLVLQVLIGLVLVSIKRLVHQNR